MHHTYRTANAITHGKNGGGEQHRLRRRLSLASEEAQEGATEIVTGLFLSRALALSRAARVRRPLLLCLTRPSEWRGGGA